MADPHPTDAVPGHTDQLTEPAGTDDEENRAKSARETKFVADHEWKKGDTYMMGSVKRARPHRKVWPEWHNSDWGTRPWTYAWESTEEKLKSFSEFQQAKLPDGVGCMHPWDAKCGSLALVAAYAEFKSVKALATFLDLAG